MNIDGNTNRLKFLRNILIKTILLLVLFNAGYAFYQPGDRLGRLSAYNIIFPGRPRLPFGESPELAYNLTLNNFEAMFASHKINAAKKELDEFRILLVGDSSVWGYLLPPEDTLSEKINQAKATLSDGRRLQVFNLGYPTISLTKDLVFLNQGITYQPDLIIWVVTLEAFPKERQLLSPILQKNPQKVVDVIRTYGLQIEIPNNWTAQPSFLSETIIGQRRELADLFRLQLLGIPWSATGIDQYYPDVYEPPENDLSSELAFGKMLPPRLDSSQLALEVLSAGTALARETPVLVVNEPIFRSNGKNSNLRYNFFYPKWAYDQYREMMNQHAPLSDWDYLDAWDLVPPAYFTNSAIHVNAAGSQMLADAIIQKILSEPNLTKEPINQYGR